MGTICKPYCTDKKCAILFGVGFVVGHCINAHLSVYCIITGVIAILSFYASTKMAERFF